MMRPQSDILNNSYISKTKNNNNKYLNPPDFLQVLTF